ncbi:hypothetical protein EUX98_g1778 [Antrodiella citrinella]|uniref:Uncharacterized protein n=1 Tax=Antrodiella citrinella TaxID=2447956 RepID=A0A4S4N902_9APHY|nr:hypothetical protein EUX98_g1778 [Antrodiella citrinella]
MPRVEKKLKRRPRPALPPPLRKKKESPKKEVIPGPIDQWLIAHRARDIGQAECPITVDEARVRVEMKMEKGEVDDFFADLDEYSLHWSITFLRASGRYIVTPESVLDMHTGQASDDFAPQWVSWPLGTTGVFRLTKEELVQFFISMRPERDDDEVRHNVSIWRYGI